MHRIVSIITKGVEDAADTLRIDHDLRNRRRIVFTTTQGEEILLDMPRSVHLRDGDGLALDDGRVVRVEAAPEALVEIHAHDLPALVRIAWHLGNRHLPTQLLGDRLRIREDHVIADMVAGLGGHTHKIMAPFDPEGGAYAEDGGVPQLGHGHGHHHHQHDDEEHDHAHHHHG
jgi:urease accessory protein